MLEQTLIINIKGFLIFWKRMKYALLSYNQDVTDESKWL